MLEAQRASLRLADGTAERIAGLWVLHEAGRFTLDELLLVGPGVVAEANAAAVRLGDLAVTAEVVRQRGRPVVPLGLRPTALQIDRDRIARGIGRALDRAADPVGELRVWARSEPLLTTATTIQVAMRRHGASGWVRQTEADPCPVCAEWADGVVRPVTVEMARHTGCACVPVPVLA